MRKCSFRLNIIFMIPTKENEETKDDRGEFQNHNSYDIKRVAVSLQQQ